MLDQIDRTSDAILKITGPFRPPYGSFTLRQRPMLYDKRNLPTILWSVNPQDWRRPGVSVVASRILTGSCLRAIILSHDIQSGTAKAMPQALDGCGLHFATVSQMMAWPLWQTRNFRRATANG